MDSLDWKGLSASDIVKRVVPKVKPGSIVLFHNAADHTPEALPTVIEELKAEGYSFVTVSQLVLTKDYHIEHDGTQVKNAPAASGMASKLSSLTSMVSKASK